MKFTHTEAPRRVLFGDGTIETLRDEVRTLGFGRVLFLSTARSAASRAGEAITRALGNRLAATFSGIEPHLPAPIVQQVVAIARKEGCDGVVGLGGGAVIDGCKAVSFFSDQGAGGRDARFLDLPAIPSIAIPTTYSGAEMTPNFGMTDLVARRKAGGGAPHTAPKVIIYDPELTHELPAYVSASTGMNALAHCVEAAYSPRRTPAAEAIAIDGARRIAEALPRVVAAPADAQARAEMLAAAWLAGWVLNNAPMCAHHGLCHALGGRLGVAHGVANSVMLAHVMRFNADAAPAAMARLASAFGVDPDDPYAAAEAVDAIRAGLGLPATLSAVGVTEDDIDGLAEHAAQSPVVANNPRPLGAGDVAALYRAAL